MISRRLVFLFPGFETLSAQQHADGFRRGAAKSAVSWDARIDLPETDSGGAVSDPRFPIVPIALSGDGWRTETELVVCDWSDLIGGYSSRGAWARVRAGVGALADFLVSGTFLRYCRVSWRYALFFLYPVSILLFILAAAVLTVLAPILWGSRPSHLLWSGPAGLCVAAAVSVFAVRRMHLLMVMDDWAFARDLCRGTNADISNRLAAQRDVIVERMTASDADEIVVAGHSLGASLAVVALANALAKFTPQCPVHVFTVGSSLLKTALHPAARAQREAVDVLVRDHRLHWVDVQAVSDPLNFYRSNPALSLDVTGGRTPVVCRISLSKSVGQRTRELNRRSFFRRHRQFVYGSEKRHAYSFHMTLLGPVDFRRYAEAGSIALPPLDLRDADPACSTAGSAAS